MANGRFVAYYRVSTDKQGRSGLGLDAQKAAVMGYLNGGQWSLVEEFIEVESGKRTDRPELDKAIRAAKRHKATLIIAKLDRLARNVYFIAKLMNDGVEFVAADMPMANRLTVHILAAVAEHEREMISMRTKAALAAAKARGIRLGSPDPGKGARKGAAATKALADAFAANVLPVIREIQKAGITTTRGIAKALDARGVRTARGGSWGPSTVAYILARAQ